MNRAMIWGWAPIMAAAPVAATAQQTTDPVPTASRVIPEAATGDTQRPPRRRYGGLDVGVAVRCRDEHSFEWRWREVHAFVQHTMEEASEPLFV